MIKKYACSDGMCGADDCYRCHPENFRNTDNEYDYENENIDENEEE